VTLRNERLSSASEHVRNGELDFLGLYFAVARYADNLLLWPTGRGNYLRDGRP
jgi:hypothetical protein